MRRCSCASGCLRLREKADIRRRHALISLLVLANFGHGLVGVFQIIILIGTMTTLIPDMLCSAGLMQLMVDRRHVFPASVLILVLIACLAFVFAIWALYGSGREAVFWG